MSSPALAHPAVRTATVASASGQVVVGISDLKVVDDPNAMLVTHSLGSCIGVAAHCPRSRVTALLHFQLPEARMDPQRAVEHPLMFCDTGLDTMLRDMAAKGADVRRLIVRLAGGAKMFESGTLDIGRRNHQAARKQLWKHGLFVAAEDCGGNKARTLYLRAADGAVRLRINGQVVAL